MPLDDRTRFLHMIDAAEAALRYCRDMDSHAFRSNDMVQRAVFQCIEVIGEAASHITPVTREQLPEVPWKQIVGMRHQLVHVYFVIDVDLVWAVVTDDLPPLVAALHTWLIKQDRHSKS
ncbi:MAG: DUF86 domain-containing protein [Phycisphaera sp.]|nr:DUF86 domain-containing protein [Phycisphaera sp.]